MAMSFYIIGTPEMEQIKVVGGSVILLAALRFGLDAKAPELCLQHLAGESLGMEQ